MLLAVDWRRTHLDLGCRTVAGKGIGRGFLFLLQKNEEVTADGRITTAPPLTVAALQRRKGQSLMLHLLKKGREGIGSLLLSEMERREEFFLDVCG